MKFGFKGRVFGLLAVSASGLFSGTASVDVRVKDAATGGPVKDAWIVVMSGLDTVAAAASGIEAASRFRLDVSTAAVEGRGSAVAGPAAFSVVEAFPNPCDDRVTLAVNPDGGALRMEVFNVLGRRVYAGRVMTNPGEGAAVDLGLENLASGIYFVAVTDRFGKTASGKFLKLGRGVSSAYSAITLTAVRPFRPAWRKSAVRPGAEKSAAGTPYTFTAYTSKNSTDADGRHVGGFATAAVTVRGDTALDLMLERVPFSRDGQNMAPRANSPIIVDGKGDESAWSSAEWGPINRLWLGAAPSPEDFTGRYKMVWTPERLYVLVEIRDDVLSDQHPDPLTNYWMDDAVELFIDEDAAGGNHQYNYNAFAYHIALDYHLVDLGLGGQAMDFSGHADVKRTADGDVYTWEIGLKVFPKTFDEKSAANVPVTLSAGKIMGFMIAYCDNDGTYDRQSFIGSIFIPGADKNVGWIDAGVFGTLELIP
jgi:hypothetical protein